MEKTKQDYLLTLSGELQNLIDQLNQALTSASWQDVAELDMAVNRLAHECVKQGVMQEPVIHGKVMLLVSLYRSTIHRLQGHKQSIHNQWQQGKEQLSAQKMYESSSSACA